MRSPNISLHRPWHATQEATVSAGDQSVLLSVLPFSPDENPCYYDDGARIDLSFAEDKAPLLVTVDLKHVSVPGHYFNHRMADERGFLRAKPCIEALAKIQRRLDKRTWSADTLSEIADDLRAAGLLVREPEAAP